MQSIAIETSGAKANELQTFWQQSDVDLSRGMDFQPRGAVFVRFTHLNHRPFNYKIVVQSNSAKQGTCRIFMAPKFDERGNPWLFRDQKVMFIELDKFRVNCKYEYNKSIVKTLISSKHNVLVRRKSRRCGKRANKVNLTSVFDASKAVCVGRCLLIFNSISSGSMFFNIIF